MAGPLGHGACDIEDEKSHKLVSVAPRSILKRQIERAGAYGFSAAAASELEYYIFNQSYKEADAGHFHNLEPAGWYIEDYHMMQDA